MRKSDFGFPISECGLSLKEYLRRTVAVFPSPTIPPFWRQPVAELEAYRLAANLAQPVREIWAPNTDWTG